jgi:hypothetical protein
MVNLVCKGGWQQPLVILKKALEVFGNRFELW